MLQPIIDPALPESLDSSMADNSGGLEIDIVGEIAKMIELSVRTKAKQPILDEMSRSVKMVAGTCNHRELTLPPIAI